jgi:prolyl oligopeptidase
MLLNWMDIAGRVGRRDFWSVVLLASGLMTIGYTMDWFVFGALRLTRPDFFACSVCAILILPLLTFGIRRLRDAGRSGWLMLLVLVPVAGWLMLARCWCEPSRSGAAPEPHAPRQTTQGTDMHSKALSAIVLLASAQSGCRSSSPVTYPVTTRSDVVETHFGKKVADPYRWLENDAGKDKNVAAWIAAERRTTSAYLDALPGRDVFRKSLTSAYNYERLGAPQKEGGRYFYTRKDGQRDLPALYVRDGANGRDRLLVDPALWSSNGSKGLAEWRASEDGTRLAYAVQESGGDWRTIRVLDVATARPLADEVKWARFMQIAWKKDGSGFYYSRYPEPSKGSLDGGGLSNHAIYFHRLGTSQAQDKLFYATPKHPERMNAMGMTSTGRYGVVYSTSDLVHTDITVFDLENENQSSRKLIENPQSRWSVVDNVGTTLYLLTDEGAERSKIVSVDLAAAQPVFVDVVPQQGAIMTAASILGGKLVVSYLVDAKSEIRRYTLQGVPNGTVSLPGIGTVSGVTGDAQDTEAFFVFASFNQPNTVYRYDVVANVPAVWVKPEIEANLDLIVVEQVSYASKDGTRIPMFIVRRKDVAGPAPTVLMGYGAFAINQPPAYSAMLTAWVLQGGVLAMPSIRGGGEFGANWHAAGRADKKQNSFDDFIAAAEYLHANKIAPRNGITAYGASAGGLLIGAVVNQRPDLFGAALPAVGVMDMLRYNRFTGGQLWLSEYGNPAVEAQFNTLLSYSPYHNVRPGKSYPAILVTTGEADDRVVPAHSFKYAAALQAQNLGPKPRLLRIDARAGHGLGKPATQAIEEAADMWAFAAHWTGLKLKDGQ